LIVPPTAVLAGELWTGSTELGLARGLRRAGWAVHEVDRARHQVQLGNSRVARAVRRMLGRGAAIAGYRADVLDAVATIRPDVFLVIKGADLDAATLARIRALGARTAVFYPDVHFDFEGVCQDAFRQYEYFITTKTFQLDYLRARLPQTIVEHLHHGYCDEVHRPYLADVQESEYVADLAYCGNHNAYKQRWLEALAMRLPNLRLHILGHHWQRAIQGTVLARCSVERGCVGYGYARTIQLSRINLAIHGGPAGSQGWADLVSTRTFEIPACGGFMLHVDSPEVRALYEPGKEIDVFGDVDELAARVEHYLQRPDTRAQMRHAAYRRCVPGYGYAARAAQLASILARPSLQSTR
jgi:glycosyltransferase involved in cell wall biosynthesis